MLKTYLLTSVTQEHFDQGAAEDNEFPNRWPKTPDLAGYQPFMENVYRKCDSVCLSLVSALEIGFGVEDNSLVKQCIPSATDLRLNHYPPIRVEDMRAGHTSRISPHTDFGILTLLFQDSVGGLEIEDRGNPGTFMPVLPEDGDTTEMIVNVSDTLQRWTNDELMGGVHRVTIPEPLKTEHNIMLPERFTMAYFFKAMRTTSVAPLPKFVSDRNPAKYPDITALDFQQWRNNMMYSY
jgi:isopenicillin N synthase-like dioxygenase